MNKDQNPQTLKASADVAVGDRIRMSCVHRDRDVTVLAVAGRMLTVRIEETNQVVEVPISVLYT